MPSLRQKDIRWFYVTVHDPGGMSGIQRVGNLDSQRKNQLSLQRTTRDLVFSVMPSRNSMTMKEWPSCLPIS